MTAANVNRSERRLIFWVWTTFFFFFALVSGRTFMLQMAAGKPMHSVMLVTLFTSEFTITWSPPAFGAHYESEDEVAHARAIGHDQCAEDRPFNAAGVHFLKPPNHQK